MRIFILFLLFFIYSAGAVAGDRNDPIEVVRTWNALHNNQQVYEFRNLYASNVLFYGRDRSGENCYLSKAKFLTTDFSQEIISDIDLRYYSSGIVKCDFRKRVTTLKGINEHDCYLLLKKIGGRYYITGESDLETDQKRGVSLDFLGNEVGAFNIWKLSLAGLAIAVVSFGIYRVYRNRSNQKAGNNQKPEPDKPEPQISVSTEPKQKTIVYANNLKKEIKEELYNELKKELTPEEKDEKAKGLAFEKFVVSKFNINYFKILEWRGDKEYNGISAESNKLPDLEIEYKSKSETIFFAVECKWRSAFYNDSIEWAKDYQIRNYREFMEQSGLPVFVIIGVGGKPEQPNEVYIIPLEEIWSTKLFKNKIVQYKRYRSDREFFLRTSAMILE